MKIGVLSDTHDRLPCIRRALAEFARRRVGAILHAGDVISPFAAKLLTPDAVGTLPVHVIYGNNDGERAGLAKVLPQIRDGPLQLTLGGKAILLGHWIEDLADADVAAGMDAEARRARLREDRRRALDRPALDEAGGIEAAGSSHVEPAAGAPLQRRAALEHGADRGRRFAAPERAGIEAADLGLGHVRAERRVDPA